MYSTDNGPHRNSWPDGGMTPFRSEKNTNWEGAFRIPLHRALPGQDQAGPISNEIVQHHDWLPTFLELAGNKTVVENSRRAYKAIGRTYKNHIDGVSLLEYLTGKSRKVAAQGLRLHLATTATRWAMRYDNWKIVFIEQRCRGTMPMWAEPFTRLRMPKLFNLRTDPYEFADQTSNTYYDWFMHHAYFIYAAQAGAAKFVETFEDFPQIQKPGSFTIDDAIAKMSDAAAGAAELLASWSDGAAKSAITGFAAHR